MADDWDESYSVGATEYSHSSAPVPATGKTFRGRGRGFMFESASQNNGFGRNSDRPPRNDQGNNFRSNKYDRGSNDNDDNNGFGRQSYRPQRNDDNSERRHRGRDQENGFERRDKKDGFSDRPRNRGDKEFNGGNEGTEEAASTKPEKMTYIPPELTDDLYDSGIKSGINFDKYDQIKVKVTGNDVPPTINSFEEAGLRKFLLEKVMLCKYKKPTPVQKAAIPIIMRGRDVMACAQTGSGKTAAFLLPIINRLLADPAERSFTGSSEPRAVIIAPTHELATQIWREAVKFTQGTSCTTCVIYGGTNVSHQVNQVRKGCDILVATAGRLQHFVDNEVLNLQSLKFLVLDEADRMLDMGFQPVIEKFIESKSMVPKTERQTLMFSATFPDEVQKLARKYLHNYLFIAVGVVGGACSDVEQRFIPVTRVQKLDKVFEVLKEVDVERTVVFVEMKRTADIVAVSLSEKHIPTTSIHGDRQQKLREEALDDFRSGRRKVLIATAVASRGLDIKDVGHVINMDLPKEIDEYVHRIGRTGRLGNRGLATSLFNARDDAPLAPALVRILEQAGQEVPQFLVDCADSQGGNGDFSGSGFDSRDNRKCVRPAEVPATEMSACVEDEDWD